MAQQRGLTNFSVLVSHVLVPPAMTAILEAPDNRVQGFLGPGHVCTVDGLRRIRAARRRYRVPIVVTGFEPVDLLEGMLRAVRQLEAGRAEVENQYGRAVRREGNAGVAAADRRGVRGLRPQVARHRHDPEERLPAAHEYRDFDAERRFEVRRHRRPRNRRSASAARSCAGCKKPHDCPAFGKECTPQTPLGATMVSSEGACAAYYAYGRHLEAAAGDRRPKRTSRAGV